MNRKEFLQTCAIFGIGLPVQNVLSSCQKEEIQRAPFTGKVLIIGAGAGGDGKNCKDWDTNGSKNSFSFGLRNANARPICSSSFFKM